MRQTARVCPERTRKAGTLSCSVSPLVVGGRGGERNRVTLDGRAPRIARGGPTRPSGYGCPATFTGTLLSVVVPSPSSPVKLSPQQYARPASVTPQVWWEPALRFANVRPPLTGTGSELELVESLPSGPPPQQ